MLLYQDMGYDPMLHARVVLTIFWWVNCLNALQNLLNTLGTVRRGGKAGWLNKCPMLFPIFLSIIIYSNTFTKPRGYLLPLVNDKR